MGVLEHQANKAENCNVTYIDIYMQIDTKGKMLSGEIVDSFFF
jgi:hypothetical protein